MLSFSIRCLLTTKLLKFNQLELGTSLFKSIKRTEQDEILFGIIEEGNLDLFNQLITCIYFKHDAMRAGRFAAVALMNGQYLLAHRCLYLQHFARAYTKVPENVPAVEDVYSEEKAKNLKMTALLWEIRAHGNTFFSMLPDEVIGLIAMYLQAPFRKGITDTQQRQLTFYGYRPTVTLSCPDKSNPVRISSNLAN